MPTAKIAADEIRCGPQPVPWTRTACCECDCEVAITVRMKPRVVSGEYEAICNDCVKRLGVPPGNFHIHPDQLEELTEVPGLFAFSQRFIERANKYGIFARPPEE